MIDEDELGGSLFLVGVLLFVAATVVQSNTTKGPFARTPISCSDSASTSFPVPVSPSMRTGTLLCASRSQSG